MKIGTRRVWKRLILVILSLPVLLLILLQTSTVQQWLLRRIENAANAAGIQLSARNLALDIWRLRASVEDVSFENAGVGVTAARIVVDVPWSIFSADVYDITYLEIENPVITVMSDEPVIPEPSGSPTALPKVHFRQLVVRNGSFFYTNQTTPFSISEFALEVTDNRGVLRLAQPVTIPPELSIDIKEIPLLLADDGLEFGPISWGLAYMDYRGTGSTQGKLQWAPTLAVDMTFDTDPLSFDEWTEIEAMGVVQFRDGILNITDFRARQGGGEMVASAEISDKGKSITAVWNGLRLDPSGVPGTTAGTLDLRWTASDFSDASGRGSVGVSTPQYGTASTDIKIENGVAALDLKATLVQASDVAVTANVTTGLNQDLAGSFQAVHRKYGLVTLRGNLSGTWNDPVVNALLQARDLTYDGFGPLSGSAQALLRNRVLSIRNVSVVLKQTRLDNASATVDLNSRRITGEIPRTTVHLEDVLSGVSGQVSLWGMIDGTIDRPAARFAAESTGFDVGGTHIDSAAVEGEFLDSTLRVDRLLARQAEGELAGQGDLNIKTEVVHANLNIQNLQVTNVEGLSTTAFFDGTVSGTLRQPSAQFKGELQNVIYQGQEHGNLTLDGDTAGDMATVRAHSDKYSADAVAEARLVRPYPFTVSLTATESRVQYQQYDFSASGRLQASGNLEPLKVSGISADNFTVLGEGIDLAAAGSLDSGVRVDLTANLAEVPVEGVRLTGTADAHATVTGAIEDLRIDGSLQTAGTTIRTEGMTEPAIVQADIDFSQNRYQIRNMSADIAGGTVVITGSGDLKGRGDFEFKADSIHPERLLKDRPVEGVVSAEGKATLVEPTLEGLTASARVTQFDLKVRGVDVQQGEPIQLSVNNKIGRIDSLKLKGSNTEAVIAGTADLGTGALNLSINADTDIRLIEAFVANSTAEGRLRTEIEVAGTTEQPDLNGFVDLTDARLQLAEPPVDLADLMVRLQFRGDRMEIVSAAGNLNGGTFIASGGAGFSAGGLRDAAVNLEAEGVQLEYPEGLQSEINSELVLAGSGSNVTLEGTVDILSAVYRKDIDLTREVFSRITNTTGSGTGSGPEPAPAIAQQIALDLAVRTPGLITISNNVANLDMNATLQVRGSLAAPVVLGRAAVNEGGELYFGAGVARGGGAPGERRDRYVIERGEVEFNNPVRIEPAFDFEATHELKVPEERYLITLRAYGTAADFKTEFTSDPPGPSERDIMTMLVTGRTWNKIQTEYAAAAGEQVVNYFTGQVSGFFSEAGTALGLDTVRIDPVTLVEGATENLSAQLTLGKRFTHNFGFTFSQNLRGARSQTWIADYDTFKNFTVRAVNESDKREVRLEFRQDIRLGGGPALPGRVQPRSEPILGTVNFTGSAADVKDLQDEVTEPGKPFSTYRMNEDVRSLREFFIDRDFLDARIRAQRQQNNDRVDVEFHIEQGSKITFDFEGGDVPGKVSDDIKRIWSDAIAEGPSLSESRERLLKHFRDKGYLEVKVSYRDESPGEQDRRFVFVIEQGARYDEPEWIFNGIESIEITDTAGDVLANPDAIRQRIEFELQKTGFIAAVSSLPVLKIDGKNSRFEVTVDPGPQFVVNVLEFEGNAFFTPPHLQNVVVYGATDVIADDQGERPPALEEELNPFPFTSTWIETARQRLTAEYWQQGFNDVQFEPTTRWDKSTGQVTVHFKILEGLRQVIDSVNIAGADITRKDYVMRQFVFKAGDPVDYSRINLTRKKFYDTGVFKRVEIDVVPAASGYTANVRLNEEAPWRLRYGLSAANRMQTSDRELGLTGDITRNNLFGRGITSGIGVKALKKEQEGRVFLSFPLFFGREFRTTATAFRRRDVRRDDPLLSDLTTATWGLTAQQQRRLKNFYVMSYDFTYKRVRSTGPEVIPGDLETNYSIGRFNATLSRDTRDDILNATRGTFLSSSFEIAPPWVGSDFQYLKQFTQFLRFEPVKKNLVWASGVRAGVAWSFGKSDVIPAAEQFLTGGGTTLRAFEQDRLTTEAGNAVLILNQELRFPLFWRIGGVAFFDAGNVYKSVGNFKAWDLRYSPGVGVRLNTPFLLLRFDVGLNLAARAGEPPRRFVFGIGQAF